MSRGLRKQKQTVLIYCEGVHDMMFMKHLRKLYGDRNPLIHFEIKPGTGGAPTSIVLNASKVIGDFQIRIAKLDNDKGRHALQAAYQLKQNVKIAYCSPAIEATLLEILEPGKSYRNHSTKSCKKRLHDKYIPEKDRTDPRKYDDHFNLKVLEAARTSHVRLNRIIEIFEHGPRWQGFAQDENNLY